MPLLSFEVKRGLFDSQSLPRPLGCSKGNVGRGGVAVRIVDEDEDPVFARRWQNHPGRRLALLEDGGGEGSRHALAISARAAVG